MITTTMKERPIPFSSPMVRAILQGRKTQTRRIMKSQPYTLRVEGFGYPTKAGGFVSIQSEHCLNECSYGKPGDHLWVREAWKTSREFDDLSPKQMIEKCRAAGWKSGKAWAPIEYLADGHRENWDTFTKDTGRFRNSRFLPRDYSRITLEISDVRVQRLQEISYTDAIAEGMPDFSTFLKAGGCQPLEGESFADTARRLRWPQRWFQALWIDINGPGSWDANPWVWAITFREVQP